MDSNRPAIPQALNPARVWSSACLDILLQRSTNGHMLQIWFHTEESEFQNCLHRVLAEPPAHPGLQCQKYFNTFHPSPVQFSGAVLLGAWASPRRTQSRQQSHPWPIGDVVPQCASMLVTPKPKFMINITFRFFPPPHAIFRGV